MSTGRPPWWFRFSPSLQEQWTNPIFQRNYVRKRIGTPKEPLKMCVWFMLASYIYNVGVVGLKFLLGYSWDDMLEAGIIGSIILGPGVIYIYLIVKMFIACLISTSSSMRANLGAEEPDAVLSTPLADKDFYFGETLPNFIGGIDLCIIFSAINISIVIPFVLVTCVPYVVMNPEALSIVVMIPFWSMGFGMYALYLVVNVILMMLLLSYAVGRWLFGFSIFAAVVLALLHYFWINLLAGISMLILGVLGLPLSIGVMILGANLTAKAGVVALSKYRRQGEYYAGRVIGVDRSPAPEKYGKMRG